MTPLQHVRHSAAAAILIGASACAGSTTGGTGMPSPAASMSSMAPSPDPRVGLKAGLMDAGEATWNLRVVSKTQPSPAFLGKTSSDMAFTGNYVIQGSYNGYQVWDIANPAKPTLKTAFVCPASQSDVSVYKNLLFVSGEGLEGRLDCGAQGVPTSVSKDRLRGLRIFDITDITNPKNVGNVQTCRGSHTHTVLVDPKDPDNVYVYISGSSPVRSAEELPGCSSLALDKDSTSALFRIEVIKVPVNNPAAAAIVGSPRIFNDLIAPPRHGEAPEDIAAAKKNAEAAKARGLFTVSMEGQEIVLPPNFTKPMVDSVVAARQGTTATAADSAAVRDALPEMLRKRFGIGGPAASGPRPGPTQCHDITVYPGIGLAGGACEGYGLLLDIRDPTNPVRVGAVSDSNFSYWHSATFNNDGTKVLFSDEWGGGGQPKCRATDRKEWGANAIFTLADNKMTFQNYYKMPAAQTRWENCVAHNGSMIPIPGRDVMVQSWYQGGVSVFDWTDAKMPFEIAFFDRGPSDTTRVGAAGTWSVYWYNGVLVSSEMERGLDIFELTPSPMLTQNELDASKTVKLDYLNAQGQPKYVWPASFALVRAYVDQLNRSGGLAPARISALRQAMSAAEQQSGTGRSTALTSLSASVAADAAKSRDAAKVRMLSDELQRLASAS